VSLNRIAVFLAEEEVTEQVSSLLHNSELPLPSSEDNLLGFANASFKWNEVETPRNGDKKPDHEATTESEITIDTSLFAEPRDHRFELRDISVIFPEGKLTVITGPTASGKTALLVRPSHFISCCPSDQP